MNSVPVFSTALQSLTITYCKATSYLLPSVSDPGGDDYSITATLYDGSLLPSWIYFDSRKVIILMLKGVDLSKTYDLKITITDSRNFSTDYKLTVKVDNYLLKLKYIKELILVSPQEFVYSYEDILDNSSFYDLNSSITLKNVDNSDIPFWITESKSKYICKFNTSFNQKDRFEYKMYFEVDDYCGDKHFTNIFNLIVLPNKAPFINHIPQNATFYKGQSQMIIITPNDMFVDPGDTFSIFTSLCIEKDSILLRTSYNESGNYIKVTYPKGFASTCTIAIGAKDSADNISLTLYQIIVNQCFQSECASCIGSKMQNCIECADNHIMNMRTKECIPILSITSLSSIKIFGIMCFFILFLHIIIQFVFKLFIKNSKSSESVISIISMIQTILIVSNFDNKSISNMWKEFIDGFQYFKFEFRLLNPVFHISRYLNGESESVPDKMYNLYFENKSAVICFCNFLIVLIIATLLNVLKHFIIKYIKSKECKNKEETKKKVIELLQRL